MIGRYQLSRIMMVNRQLSIVDHMTRILGIDLEAVAELAETADDEEVRGQHMA